MRLDATHEQTTVDRPTWLEKNLNEKLIYLALSPFVSKKKKREIISPQILYCEPVNENQPKNNT